MKMLIIKKNFISKRAKWKLLNCKMMNLKNNLPIEIIKSKTMSNNLIQNRKSYFKLNKRLKNLMRR